MSGSMPAMTKLSRVVDITPKSDEYAIWKDFAEPALLDAPPNIRSIFEYGFTEMVNNVIDHSGSPKMGLVLESTPERIHLLIHDEGVGIFKKVRDAFGLSDEHSAALEIAKGKLTTNPERHTGEGIFFTARMFDHFQLISGSINFNFAVGGDDWIFEGRTPPYDGTIVSMAIDPKSKRTTKEVFDRFASGDADFKFDSTVLSIGLYNPDGPLVSRSQAKRVLARLEDFRTVILNFEGVESISPAFADEIFRVFRTAHPEVHIVPIGANEDVDKMILRAVTRNGDASESSEDPTSR